MKYHYLSGLSVEIIDTCRYIGRYLYNTYADIQLSRACRVGSRKDQGYGMEGAPGVKCAAMGGVICTQRMHHSPQKYFVRSDRSSSGIGRKICHKGLVICLKRCRCARRESIGWYHQFSLPAPSTKSRGRREMRSKGNGQGLWALLACPGRSLGFFFFCLFWNGGRAANLHCLR